MSLLDLINGLDPQNGRGFDDLNEMLARLRAAKPDPSGNDTNAGYGMAVKDMPKPPTPDAQSWTPSLEPAQRMETTEPKNFTVPQTAAIVRPNPQAQPPMPQSGQTAMQPQAGQAQGNFALPKPTIAQHLMNIGAGFTGRGATDLNQQWETQNQLGRSLVEAGVAPTAVAAALQQPELMKQLVAAKFGPKATPTHGVVREDAFGRKIYGWIDPTRQKTTTEDQDGTGTSASNSGGLTGPDGEELHGEALLKGVNDHYGNGVATIVKKLAAGEMPFPTGQALRTPYWQTMLQLTSQYDPDFDATNYNVRNKTRVAFTSGAPATNLTSLNTAVNHMGSLMDKIDGMDNYSFMPGVSNLVRNTYRHNTDPDYQKKEAKFETNRQTAVTEIAKAIRGAGAMNEHELKEWEGKFNRDSSPETMKGAIEEALSLLMGRMEPLANQYNAGTHKAQRVDGPMQLLSPKAQKLAAKIMGQAEPTSVGNALPELWGVNGEKAGVGNPVSPESTAAPLNLRGVPDQPPPGAVTGPDGKVTIANPNFDTSKPENASNPRRLRWVP